jgi:hypothetical protein
MEVVAVDVAGVATDGVGTHLVVEVDVLWLSSRTELFTDKDLIR